VITSGLLNKEEYSLSSIKLFKSLIKIRYNQRITSLLIGSRALQAGQEPVILLEVKRSVLWAILAILQQANLTEECNQEEASQDHLLKQLEKTYLLTMEVQEYLL
jgi:hypothetical protein